MATETKTFYPGAYVSSTFSYSSGASNPVGKGSDNTSYATFGIPEDSYKEYTAYYSFSLSSIPDEAEIESVSCLAKGNLSGTGRLSKGYFVLCHGTTEKGEQATLLNSSTTHTISAGAWTRQELDNCRLKMHVATSNTANTYKYLYFYGADLTVTYTYQSEKFMLKLGGAWQDIARVFKKVNGIWVEQTDLANVIEDGVRYQNGGEYISPYKTVNITGSGEDSVGYFHSQVSIGDVTYKSATTLYVEPGTVANIYTYQHAIYLNGVQVASATMFPEYNHTINSDCVIVLTNSDGGIVTIETK